MMNFHLVMLTAEHISMKLVNMEIEDREKLDNLVLAFNQHLVRTRTAKKNVGGR